jgi:hypothetical protein
MANSTRVIPSCSAERCPDRSRSMRRSASRITFTGRWNLSRTVREAVWLFDIPAALLHGIRQPPLPHSGMNIDPDQCGCEGVAVANRRGEIVAAGRILVMEDGVSAGQMIGLILADTGCELIGPATSNVCAVDLIASHTPDAVLLDVTLGSVTSFPISELLTSLGIHWLQRFAGRRRNSDSPLIRWGNSVDRHRT